MPLLKSTFEGWIHRANPIHQDAVANG